MKAAVERIADVLETGVVSGSGVYVDRSGTIAAGGSSQVAAAANSGRRYLLIENVSASEDLWVDFGTAAVATQPSILIPVKTSWEPPFVPTGSVNVLAATTGHAYVVKEA